MKTIHLTRKELSKIEQVLSKFSNVEQFYLDEESVSGIGSILTMRIQSTINDIDGEFSVEISGVETW